MNSDAYRMKTSIDKTKIMVEELASAHVGVDWITLYRTCSPSPCQPLSIHLLPLTTDTSQGTKDWLTSSDVLDAYNLWSLYGYKADVFFSLKGIWGTAAWCWLVFKCWKLVVAVCQCLLPPILSGLQSCCIRQKDWQEWRLHQVRRVFFPFYF